MDVKGTAFLARRTFVTRDHGADAFEAVVAHVAKLHPSLGEPVVATTRIPVRAFIALNDEIVMRLYGGDQQSYFRFGEESAVWGLTVGPYKSLVAEKSVRGLVASVPVIYKSYFSEGECIAKLKDESCAELRIQGVEPRHVYFEYAISGYFARGLEIVSDRLVKMNKLRGFSLGDRDVHYEMLLGAARKGTGTRT
jgi:hypothetical protein